MDAWDRFETEPELEWEKLVKEINEEEINLLGCKESLLNSDEDNIAETILYPPTPDSGDDTEDDILHSWRKKRNRMTRWRFVGKMKDDLKKRNKRPSRTIKCNKCGTKKVTTATDFPYHWKAIIPSLCYNICLDCIYQTYGVPHLFEQMMELKLLKITLQPGEWYILNSTEMADYLPHRIGLSTSKNQIHKANVRLREQYPGCVWNSGHLNGRYQLIRLEELMAENWIMHTCCTNSKEFF